MTEVDEERGGTEVVVNTVVELRKSKRKRRRNSIKMIVFTQ